MTLDSFRTQAQNIDNDLDMWLVFLTRDDIESVINLVNRYPEFADIYAEIAELRTDPRAVMNMFSKALAIMDRNTERFMVEEMEKKIEDLTIKNNENAKRADMAESRANVAESRADSAEAELARYKARYGDFQ